MKNQQLNQYQYLPLKEIATINGGCGGEDLPCPIDMDEVMGYIGLLH